MHVAACAADQQGLDRVDDLPDVGVRQVPDHHVGAAARRQASEISTSQGVSAAERCSIEIILRPAGGGAMLGEPAEDKADLHIEQHIGR